MHTVATDAAAAGFPGLGKVPVFPDGICKLRVRKAADTVSVAPMGGAEQE